MVLMKLPKMSISHALDHADEQTADQNVAPSAVRFAVLRVDQSAVRHVPTFGRVTVIAM